jgi:hypothetical protein
MWMFIAGVLATLVVILACILADQNSSRSSQRSGSASPDLYTSSREVRNTAGSYRSTTDVVPHRRTVRYAETPSSTLLEYRVEGPLDVTDAVIIGALARRLNNSYADGSYLPIAKADDRRALPTRYSVSPSRSLPYRRSSLGSYSERSW